MPESAAGSGSFPLTRRPTELRARALVVGPNFPYPPTSGGVKRTLRLLESMDRAGAEVHYFTVDPGTPDALAEMRERGWVMHVQPDDTLRRQNRVHQHLRLRPGPWSRNLALALQRSCVPGVAFVQAEHVHHAGYLSQCGESVRILSTHNVDSQLERARGLHSSQRSGDRLRHRYREMRMARAERASGRTAEAVVCVSDDDARHYRKHADTVLVAPNGVDDEFFASEAQQNATSEEILFFGQMTYDPNFNGIQRFLREAWPTIAAVRPRARLLIAGEGSRERLGSFGECDRVAVMGLVDDIAALVRQVRIVIVPIWQGSGTRLKVVEGLAAGRPVVGTSLGVAGIGFRNGVHGMVADEPEDFATAVIGLCGDTKRSADMGHAGRALASQYRWQTALASVEGLYEKLVQDVFVNRPPVPNGH